MNKWWAKYKFCGLFTFAHTLCHARTLSHTRQTHIHAHVCMCILSFHNAAKSILIGDYLYYYYYCITKIVLLTVCRLIRNYILHYIRQRWFDSIFFVRFHATFFRPIFSLFFLLFLAATSRENSKQMKICDVHGSRLTFSCCLRQVLTVPKPACAALLLWCSARCSVRCSCEREREQRKESAMWESDLEQLLWADACVGLLYVIHCCWENLCLTKLSWPGTTYARESESFRLTHSGLCCALQLFVRALWQCSNFRKREENRTNTRLEPGLLIRSYFAKCSLQCICHTQR